MLFEASPIIDYWSSVKYEIMDDQVETRYCTAEYVHVYSVSVIQLSL